MNLLAKLCLLACALAEDPPADAAYQAETITACSADAVGACDDEAMASMKVSLLQTSTRLQSDVDKMVAPGESVMAVIKQAAGEIHSAKVSKESSSSHMASLASRTNSTESSKGSKPTADDLMTALVSGLDYALSICVFAVVLAAAYMVPKYAPVDFHFSDYAPLCAEFVGTFVLVFTIACCSVAGSSTWNATAIAVVLMVAIYATGPISGGNLNPAVSISLGLAKKLEWNTVAQYCAIQIFAGVVASFFACCLFAPLPAVAGPVAPFLWWHAAIVEFFYTTMLCFVVLNCAASKRNNDPTDGNQFFALAIGFVIIAGGYPSGGISGANFNPAVSLGFELVAKDSSGWGAMYACVQAFASILATLLFWLVRPEENAAVMDAEDVLPSSCCSEMLGTLVLVFTVGLNIVTGSPATAWSAAAALMCMIYSLGDISGAHFNPAVTVAVVLSRRGKCSFVWGIMYVLAQLAGAVFGGGLYAVLQLGNPSNTSYPLQQDKEFTVVGASVGEMIFTALLAYVVLATATTLPPASQKSKQNAYFALCIGATVVVGGTCMGNVSGGQLNPAVSVGKLFSNWMYHESRADAALLQLGFPPNMQPLTQALAHAKDQTVAFTERHPLTPCAYFSLFEVLGGVIAVIMFRLTHASEYSVAREVSLASKICAEFFGTFYLVFTVGCCCLAGSDTWNVIAIAFALMALVYSTGPVSGGNLNPAVSLCLAFSKKLGMTELLCYWATQITAGLLAGVAFSSFFQKDTALEPGDGFSWMHALSVELLYTVMLCFVVSHSAASSQNNSPHDGNQFYGLAIGFVIIAGGYAAGTISGACFNPAVSLGMDLSALKWGPIWSMAQLAASVIAAFMFRYMRPQEMTIAPPSPSPASEADAGAAPASTQSLDATAAEPPPAPVPAQLVCNNLVPVQHSLVVRCVSELLGVFVLVMTVGLNVVTGSKATAISAAAALMSMIYSLGDISGAHFNPAVTLAVLFSGRDKCSKSSAAAYVIVQLLGGVFAGHAYSTFHRASPNKNTSYPLEPGASYSFLTAGIVELFFTSLLAYTVLATATVTKPKSQISKQNFFFGLSIASCVIAGGFAIGAISGGELNPAVSLGVAIANLCHGGQESGSPLFYLLPFCLWQVSGGIIAAIIFPFTHPGEFAKARAIDVPGSPPSAAKVLSKARP